MTTHRRNPPVPAEGDLVMVQGYEFKATNVRFHPEKDEEPGGRRVMRFTGVLTADPRNDPIRGTGYDNASYGWGDW